MTNFITVDAEFRRQWDDDASLDRYLHDINLSIFKFKLAFYARNGNAAQFEKVFAPKQIFMLPTLLPTGRTTDMCICAPNQGPVVCPKHGRQDANRELCPQCQKHVLGYCPQGVYCTSEECRYAA